MGNMVHILPVISRGQGVPFCGGIKCFMPVFFSTVCAISCGVWAAASFWMLCASPLGGACVIQGAAGTPHALMLVTDLQTISLFLDNCYPEWGPGFAGSSR